MDRESKPPSATWKENTTDFATGELECHRILHQRGLAPRLFARFNNGYVYEFTSGTVCTLDALRVPHLYTLVARHMAEWHAVVPVEKSSQGEPTPNLWSVLEKWIHALPAVSEEDKARKQSFLKEREYLQAKFTGRKVENSTPGWNQVPC